MTARRGVAVLLPSHDPLWREAVERTLVPRRAVRYVEGPESYRQAVLTTEVMAASHLSTPLFREPLPQGARLRWVHALSAGVDAVLTPAVVEAGLTVTNARGFFDEPLAEYVVAMMLLETKDLRRTLHLQRNQVWLHRDTRTLKDATVLIVGAGSIGTEVARRLAAFGVRVVGVSSRGRSGDPVLGEVQPAGKLHELLPEADWVVLTVPLTPSTRNLIGAPELARMKPEARLVNIARGPVVDTEALVKARQEGRIAGAALDVFEEEPLPEGHPLWSIPGVLVSPHMGADVVGWRDRLLEGFLTQLARFEAGEPLEDRVDGERLAAKRQGS